MIATFYNLFILITVFQLLSNVNANTVEIESFSLSASSTESLDRMIHVEEARSRLNSYTSDVNVNTVEIESFSLSASSTESLDRVMRIREMRSRLNSHTSEEDVEKLVDQMVTMLNPLTDNQISSWGEDKIREVINALLWIETRDRDSFVASVANLKIFDFSYPLLRNLDPALGDLWSLALTYDRAVSSSQYYQNLPDTMLNPNYQAWISAW